MHSEILDRTIEPQSSGQLAKELRGFGLTGWFALITILLIGTIKIGPVVVPIGALLVLLWVQLSHTPWKAIGYNHPRSWAQTIIAGALFGAAFKFLTKSVIMPLLGADPINQAYHYLTGNAALLPFAVWAMLVAGFAEETVFRGYLFERIQKLLGHTQRVKVFAVCSTSLWFGLAHYTTQGFMGVIHAFIVGFTFAVIYSRTQKLYFLMIAHAVYDLSALGLIYWNIEVKVAHLFFQ